MTWRQFQKWLWIMNERPFGELAQDGRIMDVIIDSQNSRLKKNAKPNKLVYFTKKRKQAGQAIKQTAEQAAALVRAYVKRNGSTS